MDNLINYISQPDLDSGERIITDPGCCPNIDPSRIIQQYTSYCKQQEFEPASERSLFRMLEICSASMYFTIWRDATK